MIYVGLSRRRTLMTSFEVPDPLEVLVREYGIR